MQITHEMVNKSLGELKTVTKHYRPDGNIRTWDLTNRGSHDKAGLQPYGFPLKWVRQGTQSASIWTFIQEPVISQRPHYSDISFLALLQTVRWIV